ncbi:hypothetical protein [Flavobacterium algicola]|uniref:hypothetical protein n=1 Tax=Flavobacterium algicola TaxID=556529 RepID=UPI001EFC627F|nr:hypothetical protein [Flavobacterium algicola]MCG9792190.1 hypothetical protein [Flavobacterium algicola]
MKTTSELSQNIAEITARIEANFPELAKYIPEMSKNAPKGVDDAVQGLDDYYKSLQELLAEYSATHSSELVQKTEDNTNFADLQDYPASEDIYQQGVKEAGIDPEDISKKKATDDIPYMKNEIDFTEDKTGADLDVPGAELDDQQENIGSEDEENNYYSLGGDNHNDLEEDRS